MTKRFLLLILILSAEDDWIIDENIVKKIRGTWEKICSLENDATQLVQTLIIKEYDKIIQFKCLLRSMEIRFKQLRGS